MHNYQNFIDFDYYFNLFQPECVILETAEYATARRYFNINRLREKRLNPPFWQVRDTAHDSYALQELSYETERREGITNVEITISPEAEEKTPYGFGYLLIGEREFDLQIEKGRGVCSVASEYMTDKDLASARIELFVK